MDSPHWSVQARRDDTETEQRLDLGGSGSCQVELRTFKTGKKEGKAPVVYLPLPQTKRKTNKISLVGNYCTVPDPKELELVQLDL